MGRLIIPHAPRAEFADVVLAMGEKVFAEDEEREYNGDGVTPGGLPVGGGKGFSAVSSYGTLLGDTASRAALVAGLAAVGYQGSLIIDQDISVGTSPVPNPGAELIGRHAVAYTPAGTGGRRVQNKAGRSWDQLQWGREYLFRFLNRLHAGSAISVALIGDSNTAAYAGAEIKGLLEGVAGLTVTNYGVSGTTFEQWRTNTGGINGTGKDMASVLAANPDIIIDLYGGTNDPYYGGTVDSYLNSKRTAYTSIRASKPIDQLSIVLCTAASQNDGGAMGVEGGEKRDELYTHKVRAGIIDLAEEFQCAFFDKAGRLPDAFVDFGTATLSNTWLDGARVHTLNAHTKIIAQELYEFVIPSAYRVGSGGGVTNLSGSTLSKLAADLPSTYPLGLSILRTGAGFPINGFIYTFKSVNNGECFQFVVGYLGDGTFAYRTSNLSPPTGWGSFYTIGGASADVVPATGWSLPGSAENMKGVSASGTGHGDGYLVPSGAAAPLTVGMDIATLPAGQRPARVRWWAELLCWDGMGTWEKVRATIATDGRITAQQVTTINVVRIYLKDSWPTT